MKKTLVLGASTDPSRYSNIATLRLQKQGYEVVPIGVKAGNIDQTAILLGKPMLNDIDTVTLYINPNRQEDYYDYILGLQPKRVIFNPGTENIDFAALLKSNGIEAECACTLVLLAMEQY
jgi:predicted CoA-binding protein